MSTPTERITELVKLALMSAAHKRAPYEGDGAPGCLGACPRCALEDALELLRGPQTLLG